jgi:hypothetical protein
VAKSKPGDNVRRGHEDNLHLPHDLLQLPSGCTSLLVPGSAIFTLINLSSTLQVGSFNYDNTKMVFNDSFIAEEGAIRFV